MTDSDVINAMIAAKNRGVDVRVLMDPNQTSNSSTYTTLTNAGVKVGYYPVPAGTKLHMKMGVADGKEYVVGSANWTNNGFLHNHELSCHVKGATTSTTFENMFHNDWVKTFGTW